MAKVMLVAHAPDDRSAPADAALRDLGPRLLHELGTGQFPGITLQLEDAETTDIWLRRGERPARRLAATVALRTGPGADVRQVTRMVGALWPDHLAFEVAETVVRGRTTRRVSPTTAQPGRTVTALLVRAAALTRDDCVRHWIDIHQPMSLRIHPQDSYVRNIVTRSLTPTQPGFDAISEEGFASVDDILDPARFYGADSGERPWRENAAAIGADMQAFLDPGRTTATVMHEYLLRGSHPEPVDTVTQS